MISPKKELENINAFESDYLKQDWRLKLDANENIYGPYDSAINAIKTFNKEDIHTYPTYGKLIEKLATKYELKADKIFLTNGCDDALSLIANTYLDKNSEILGYDITFPLFYHYAKINGANVNLMKYSETFAFSEEDIKNNITQKTKIIYIVNPDNPTGIYVKPRIIENILSEYKNVLVVVDCAYINFSSCGSIQDYYDLVKKYDNLVVLESFSKDYALAGLRIGCIASNEENIKNIRKVAPLYRVNTVSLACAYSVLNNEKKLNEIKELNQEARQLLQDGLNMLGYQAYPSETNFILCDFGNHCDFYYNKLKNHGIIVKNFPKNSPISCMLRITVPKLSGVRVILELLKRKDVLIFEADGVIFDIENSYLAAIQKTFKHFSEKELTKQEIKDVKNKGKMSCNWQIVKHFLEKENIQVEIEDIISVFQDLFYNPKEKSDSSLINEDKLFISKEMIEKLSKTYDMVIFTGRLKDEINYSLEKFGIKKYFHYLITSDDLPKNMLKPHPQGALKILKNCPHIKIKYLANSVNDIIAGNSAEIDTIGIINRNDDANAMKNNFRHLGATYILDDLKHIDKFLAELK